MHYQITQNKLFEKGLFSITDDAGALRFQVAGNLSLSDPDGSELLAIKRHFLGRQADILEGGQLTASVHVAGLSASGNYNVDGPAGRLSAAGDFLGRNYTLTVPSGSVIATVSQQRGFRERFDVETAPGQDDVLLLAVILAIESLRDQKGAIVT
jgi:uncharacterized protein YxjI